ncbi:MAG: hypothetical protein LBG88_01375 [Christensenellaceae bacterium]|nr:hypothetical protein [Christensenellaceae bacterium]
MEEQTKENTMPSPVTGMIDKVIMGACNTSDSIFDDLIGGAILGIQSSRPEMQHDNLEQIRRELDQELEI